MGVCDGIIDIVNTRNLVSHLRNSMNHPHTLIKNIQTTWARCFFTYILCTMYVIIDDSLPDVATLAFTSIYLCLPTLKIDHLQSRNYLIIR